MWALGQSSKHEAIIPFFLKLRQGFDNKSFDSMFHVSLGFELIANIMINKKFDKYEF